MNRVGFGAGLGVVLIGSALWFLPLYSYWQCVSNPIHVCVALHPFYWGLVVVAIGLVLAGYSFRSHPRRTTGESAEQST